MLLSGISMAGSAPCPGPAADEAGMRERCQRVRALLTDGALHCHLQPIVAVTDGQVFGFEALARSRWRGALVFPDVLFGLARDTGLLDLADHRARQAALRAKETLLSPGDRLFINVDPAVMAAPRAGVLRSLESAIAAGCDPGSLVIEITESRQVFDYDQLRGLIADCQRLGVAVAFDDFGVGLPSLGHLLTLRPDFVKFDRVLIQGLQDDRDRRSLVAHLTRLCRDLGIRTVAEGIETAGDIQVVGELSVDFAQGYFLGRPTDDPGAFLARPPSVAALSPIPASGKGCP